MASSASTKTVWCLVNCSIGTDISMLQTHWNNAASQEEDWVLWRWLCSSQRQLRLMSYRWLTQTCMSCLRWLSHSQRFWTWRLWFCQTLRQPWFVASWHLHKLERLPSQYPLTCLSYQAYQRFLVARSGRWPTVWYRGVSVIEIGVTNPSCNVCTFSWYCRVAPPITTDGFTIRIFLFLRIVERNIVWKKKDIDWKPIQIYISKDKLWRCDSHVNYA